MTRKEAKEKLYELINNINADEVANQIKTHSLQEWTSTWRNTAKEVMQEFERI